MSSVVGISFGGLFDPWQQKELMLAQLKVSRARTVAGQDKALEVSSALHDQFLLQNAAAEAKEREARDALAMKVFVDAKKAVEDARRVAREAMVQAKIGEKIADQATKEAREAAKDAESCARSAQALVKEALKAEADLQAKVREEAKLHRDFLAQFSIEDFEEEEEDEEEEEEEEEDGDLEYWLSQMERSNCL